MQWLISNIIREYGSTLYVGMALKQNGQPYSDDKYSSLYFVL